MLHVQHCNAMGKCFTVRRSRVQRPIMTNVTWSRFDQSAQQLVVGHTTITIVINSDHQAAVCNKIIDGIITMSLGQSITTTRVSGAWLSELTIATKPLHWLLNSAELDGTPTILPTYIRVCAVVWECGKGQTNRWPWPIYISPWLHLMWNEKRLSALNEIQLRMTAMHAASLALNDQLLLYSQTVYM